MALLRADAEETVRFRVEVAPIGGQLQRVRGAYTIERSQVKQVNSASKAEFQRILRHALGIPQRGMGSVRGWLTIQPSR